MQPLDNQYRQWQVQAQFTKSYTTPAIVTLVLCVALVPPALVLLLYMLGLLVAVGHH